MRFKMNTVVDITNTGARKGDDPTAVNQQQNYLTALNTISMRANPLNVNVTVDVVNVTDLSIDAEGKQKLWTMYFEFESQAHHSIDMLIEDLHIIPIISQLEETVPCRAFLTQGSEINTVFELIEDK
jgi:hypothetical protein